MEYQGHHEGGQEDGRDGAHTAGRNRSDREWKDNGDPEMPTNGTGSHEPEECKRGGRVGKREVHKQRPQPGVDKAASTKLICQVTARRAPFNVDERRDPDLARNIEGRTPNSPLTS